MQYQHNLQMQPQDDAQESPSPCLRHRLPQTLLSAWRCAAPWGEVRRHAAQGWRTPNPNAGGGAPGAGQTSSLGQERGVGVGRERVTLDRAYARWIDAEGAGRCVDPRVYAHDARPSSCTRGARASIQWGASWKGDHAYMSRRARGIRK